MKIIEKVSKTTIGMESEALLLHKTRAVNCARTIKVLLLEASWFYVARKYPFEVTSIAFPINNSPLIARPTKIIFLSEIAHAESFQFPILNRASMSLFTFNYRSLCTRVESQLTGTIVITQKIITASLNCWSFSSSINDFTSLTITFIKSFCSPNHRQSANNAVESVLKDI